MTKIKYKNWLGFYNGYCKSDTLSKQMSFENFKKLLELTVEIHCFVSLYLTFL